MVNSAKRPGVDKSLQYRWGFIGVLLAGAFLIWYAHTTGVLTQSQDKQDNLVKLVCPRCNNQMPQLKTCSLCGGKGFIWVDKDKYLPDEVTTVP
jgi:hypothetical protein